jgi:hypothetical protein
MVGKKGLELHLTYLGSILVGKMVTLTVESKITNGQLFPTNWRDEIETDIAFPAVSVSKIELNDGYSKSEKENPCVALFYFEDIVMLLMNDDENKREEEELRLLSKKRDYADAKDITCDYCGENPCAWLKERDNVIANNTVEHNLFDNRCAKLRVPHSICLALFDNRCTKL